MKKLLAALIAALFVLGMAIPASAEFDINLREGVAVVATCVQLEEGGDMLFGWGTGFFVGEEGKGPDTLITNHHVIDSYLEHGAGNLVYVNVDEEGNLITVPTDSGEALAWPIGRTKIRVYYDSDDYDEAYVVEYSEDMDVAVLRLDKPTDKRKILPLRSPDESLVGSTVYAIGYPGAAENVVADDTSKWDVDSATVTKGAISRLITTAGVGRRQLQVDIQFSPGNSGGPLLTEDGYVVGINTWHISKNQTTVRYSVNIDEAITLLNRNNISYTSASAPEGDTDSALSSGAEPAGEAQEGGSLLVPVLIGAVVLAAVIVVLVLVLKKKKPAVESKPEQRNSTPPPAPAAASDLRLQGVSGTFAGRRFSVNGVVRMGRDPARNDLVFPGNVQGISGVHCTITAERGGLVLRDLKSTYGTYLGGRKITPNQPVPLNVGDKFYLGSESQMFQVTNRGGV